VCSSDLDELQSNLMQLEKITSRIQEDLTQLDAEAVKIRQSRKYKKFCYKVEKSKNKN